MRETDLYEQIAQYMNIKYPAVPYHFDLSGLWTPSHQARNLYGRLNKRAWPDLFIAKHSSIKRTSPGTNPWGGTTATQIYIGLFIELKNEGVTLYKKDGSLRANQHHQEQLEVLLNLELQGYKAVFAIGFDQAITIIDEYLSPTLPTSDDFNF